MVEVGKGGLMVLVGWVCSPFLITDLFMYD